MLIRVAAGLALVLLAARPGHAAPPVDPAMCDRFATIPNAPMTVESCKKMFGAMRDDPASHRTGDEAMSCEAILAELQSLQGVGVSPAEAARRQALIRDAVKANPATRTIPETQQLTTESVDMSAPRFADPRVSRLSQLAATKGCATRK